MIWVWVKDEAGDAPDWYPGDNYVDIIGRDYYFYPRIANHGSLVASFEKLKDLFGGNDWKSIMNNDYVITLDKMPGWANYTPPTAVFPNSEIGTEFSVRYFSGSLEVTLPKKGADILEIFDMFGKRLAVLNPEGPVTAGVHRFRLDGTIRGLCLIRARMGANRIIRRVTVTAT